MQQGAIGTGTGECCSGGAGGVVGRVRVHPPPPPKKKLLPSALSFPSSSFCVSSAGLFRLALDCLQVVCAR